MLINKEILYRVRNAVCCVGYTTVPRSQYIQDPFKPYFKVVGTGFLVRETTIATNRHVVDGLIDTQLENGFPDDQRVLIFVAPRDDGKMQIVVRLIREIGRLAERELDVGFIEFRIGPEDQFKDISPLEIQDSWDLKVSEDIAVCGYPYGHAMLQRDKRVYRWGPVIQSGFISAISPFDVDITPDEILLDVRVATGMSGAPIFRPTDGIVLGILHSGWEAITALGLPLTNAIMAEWLTRFDEAIKSE
jgi:S1-C subfamily serine protease